MGGLIHYALGNNCLNHWITQKESTHWFTIQSQHDSNERCLPNLCHLNDISMDFHLSVSRFYRIDLSFYRTISQTNEQTSEHNAHVFQWPIQSMWQYYQLSNDLYSITASAQLFWSTELNLSTLSTVTFLLLFVHKSIEYQTFTHTLIVHWNDNFSQSSTVKCN